MHYILNCLKNKRAVWSSRWHFSECQKQLRRDKITNYTSYVDILNNNNNNNNNNHNNNSSDANGNGNGNANNNNSNNNNNNNNNNHHHHHFLKINLKINNFIDISCTNLHTFYYRRLKF